MNSQGVERERVTQRSRFLSYFNLHLLVFQVVEELAEVRVAEIPVAVDAAAELAPCSARACRPRSVSFAEYFVPLVMLKPRENAKRPPTSPLGENRRPFLR